MITCHSVFNVWPKITLLLPVWPRDAKSLDTPEEGVMLSEISQSEKDKYHVILRGI